MPTPIRLRDLIRNIRAAKTAAEEREVIQKECAEIRNGFREEDNIFRCRNVAKLLYVHMLGFPAHFGQMEVMKLVVSPRFTDKRIGYLGSMLLLDENREVTMLITNSLKNDLEHSSQYVVSLALCTLGNICSSEMARDLAQDVERIMRNGPAYLKKKATLCACRIIRKEPELIDNFIQLVPSLLNDKHHGVMLAGVAFVTEMCNISDEYTDKFRRSVPALVRMLKNLIMSGFSPEHDVSGVVDPFLQVRIIRLLRILGKNDGSSSELMNDILAQVATNTETSKNVGNAILYETVLTIMGIKSESGLRVLAINILGRFLLSSDKNIRYVALNSLLKTVHTDMNAVQRHRSTILDCLKDPDPSVLRRAVDLCFALINDQNVRGTMRELLIFLENCPSEFKGDVSSNIVISAGRYAPNAQWHIDTILKVLTTGGNHVPDQTIPILIHLISSTASLHSYTVSQLFTAIKTNNLHQPLNQVACWCLGEYGEVLLSGSEYADPVQPEEILKSLNSLCESHLSSAITKSYAVNAIAKLANRLPSHLMPSIKQILARYGTSMNLELQQRSVEFSSLFNNHDDKRPGILERMPLFEKSEEERIYSEANDPAQGEKVVPAVNTAQQSALDDLLGLGDIGQSTPAAQPAPVMNSSNLVDLLGDLGMNTAPPAPQPAPVAASSIPSIEPWCDDTLGMKMDFQKVDNNILAINMTITNSSLAYEVSDFSFLAAVPKQLQINLAQPSSTSVSPGASLTQQMRINNPNKVALKMKCKMSYKLNGSPVGPIDQVIGNFPPSAWE
ncbi:Oidioi.mRNA.OKI2018_I69.chr2.g7328.t1.cds [Oikopleura dioica]|uniref:AP-1 complex subunit gamma n=1 Tax=Oikopleura dioica TaxID=34765 RepID=A0ABN7TAL8_OIKDI|nr:Oidioi.mRNA.OKI2018_I69.chr2.g7328.t1.cds [Oikopleura dioica]